MSAKLQLVVKVPVAPVEGSAVYEVAEEFIPEIASVGEQLHVTVFERETEEGVHVKVPVGAVLSKVTFAI
jgi:predicted RNA-binding protein with TRAM domain